TAGTYRLGLELGSLSAQAIAAESIAYGQSVQKLLQQSTPDLYAFNGAAGDTVNITVVLGEKHDQNATPPTLALQDAGGRTLVTATPTASGETTVEGFTLPANGRYVVMLQAPSLVSYTLVVQRRQSVLVDG